MTPAQDELTHRQLREQDLATRVVWLQDSHIREGITINFWPSLPAMTDWFSRADVDPGRRDLVLEDAGEVVSMFGLTEIDIALGAASYYGYVAPGRLRRGYGDATVRAALAVGSKLGLHTLRLETRRANVAARGLYAKHGFEVIAEDEGKLRMERTI